MRFLGLCSYPLRWRRSLRPASLLILLIAMEGIASLLAFLLDPSEPGSRAFLFYSLEKWALILASGAIILILLFFLWAIRFRAGQTERVLSFLGSQDQAGKSLFFASLFLVVSTGLGVWLSRSEAMRAHVTAVYPLLLWGFVAIVQVWIFLVVTHWKIVAEAFTASFPVFTGKQLYPLTIMDRYWLLALLGLSLVYILFLVKSFLAVRQAALIGDSWSYLYGASLDLNDPAFFSERRPWGILLVFKLLDSSQAAIGLFQLAVSASAWLWLAWTFIRSIRNKWMKLLGFSLILGLSLTPAVQLWNYTVLSESLSISLMVLILVVFLRLSQQWKWPGLLLLIVLFLFWMSFREANAFFAIFVAITLLVAGLVQRRLRAYWLLSFSIAVIFVLNHQLSSAYALPRWALPMAEVITHRILPEQEHLDYFTQNGMPVNSELMELSGKNANSNDYAVINSPGLKKFTRWLFNDSRNVYLRFLIAHPIYTVWSPVAEIQTLLGYNYFEGIPVPDYVPALPGPANELFYPLGWFWGYLGLSLMLLGLVFISHWRSNNRAFWAIAVFFLLSIPHVYLVWHGDALDVERHAVFASLQFHLGVWSLLVFFLDKIIVKRADHWAPK